jgi:hypothetical protein
MLLDGGSDYTDSLVVLADFPIDVSLGLQKARSLQVLRWIDFS